MRFRIVTPDGVKYDDVVESITIPTQSGDITVLEHHTALVSVLCSGELSVKKLDYTVSIAVSGGVVEVRENGDVYILADTAERAEHIDLNRAEAARKRAEELMLQAQHTEDVDFTRIQAMIEKEIVRIHIAKKYRG
jgi:F-type H+-transporting ATPase subunit epsilon